MESNSLRAANLTPHGDRLLRIGVLLFLLGLLTGFAIPALTNPRMGLTSHLEGLMNGMFLVLLGLVWPRLALSPRWLAATFWIALYGTFANWAGTLLAAAWGTGRTTPIAASGFSGTATQEGVVDLLLISLSLAMVAVCGLVLWGLRSRRGAPALLLLVWIALPSALRAATDPEAPPTFVDDVAPILYRRCIACHCAGEMAPMSLGTWDEVRPWVKAIRKAVANGEMPPWHADPRYGPYRNARGLDESERRILLDWIDAGAARGDGEAPTPPLFAEGWQGGEPDVVISVPQETSIPADGGDEYHYVLVPTGFGEERWVQSAEVRPGNRLALHHATVFVFPPERIEQGPDGPRLRRTQPVETDLTERVGSKCRARSRPAPPFGPPRCSTTAPPTSSTPTPSRWFAGASRLAAR